MLWWLSRAQGRAMAGIAHVFRFVGFSSHRYTAKFGNSVNPSSFAVLGGRAALTPSATSTSNILFHTSATQSLSKARRDRASALAALSRQTPLASDTRVPPSPPSMSFPLCVPSWRTSRRLGPAGKQRQRQYNTDGTLAVVAEVAVEDGGQHQTLIQQMVDMRFVCLNSDHTVLGERT